MLFSIVCGVIVGILIFATGYWFGHNYGYQAGRAFQHWKLDQMSRALVSCRETVAHQDLAIDTLKDEQETVWVQNGYATKGGRVIDLLSHWERNY